jgi:hypothetical protein
MQYIDGVVAHSVKNPEWIPNNRNDADVRALRDARNRFGCMANAVNNVDQPTLDRCGYRGTGTG